MCHKTVLSGEHHTHQVKMPSHERKRMRQTVSNWRRLHGDLCPGYQRTAHHAADLQADHVIPRSKGGLGGSLQVLCGKCNRIKSDQ